MRKIHDIYSTICFIVFSIPSVLLIAISFQVPDPDGLLGTVATHFIAVEELESIGVTFYDVIFDIFPIIAWINVCLLILTYIYIITLNAIKIPIHWLIKSGIFLILAILVNHIFLNTTIFAGAQDFSAAGVVTLTVYTTIYYLVMFYLILIVKNWLSKKHVQR